MYEYVTKDERIALRDVCEKIIKLVQDEVRDYFTFDFKLIGSGEKRLITKNTNNGNYDLDFNLIIQKDKQDLINYPKKIKDIFINAFNKINKTFDFTFSRNRKNVITCPMIYDNKLQFSFDVAIMVEGNNGNLYKIHHDVNYDRYIWNQVKDTKEFNYRFRELKHQGYWEEIKDRYLDKKNYYLRKQIDIASFSVLLETVNEIWNE